MISRNYHTHTKRCGHAKGNDEEYVLNAIKANVSELGFSDHAPYIENEPGIRMPMELKEDYVISIKNLKEKYADEISIYTGMEIEYFETELETLKNHRKEMDYCILGQHNFSYKGRSSYELDSPQDLKTYTDCLYNACKIGLCDYIAHPDLPMWNYPVQDESVKLMAKNIAEISKKFNVPLELNCGSGVLYGKRKYEDGMRYAYPTRICFEEFAKQNCLMIIGMDIHNPELFLTDEYLNRALSVVEGLNIHFLNDDTDFNLILEATKRKKEFGY